MVTRLLLTTALLGLSAGTVSAWDTGEGSQAPLIQDGERMLFIGNSYTANEGGVYSYLAEALRVSGGPSIHHDRRIYYGKPLAEMFTNDVQTAIRSNDYDTVVITSGALPVMKKFEQAIRQSGKSTVVFGTWAGRHPGNRATIDAYTAATRRMVADLRAMENDTGATIVPVSLVYHDLTVRPPQEMPRVDYLWMKQNIHQNELGTLVNAWMFYAVLTGKSPVGLDMEVPPFVVDGKLRKTPEIRLTPKLRDALQQRVWKIAQQWKSGATYLEGEDDSDPERTEEAPRPARRRREIRWINPDIPKMQGLTHKVLTSKSMGRDVGYVVWTPPALVENPQRRCPVIYFLHGAGGSERSDSAGFSSHVQRAIKANKLPPTICVFPNGGMSGYRGDVETMIVEELIPRIDESYPTIAKSSGRVVCGFSMGGAGSVHLSLRHPELFCAAGSWGGALSFRGNAKESPLLATAKSNAEKLKGVHYSLLTINGDADRPDAFEPLKSLLGSQGIEHRVVTVKDTNHNLGKYYERTGEAMLDFLGQKLGNQGDGQ